MQGDMMGGARRAGPMAMRGAGSADAGAGPGEVWGAEDLPTSAQDVLHGHELRRRRRLVRILSLGVMIPCVLLIPGGLIPKVDPVTLTAVLIGFAGALLAYLLNMRGWVSAAGYALLGGVALGVGWEIVATAYAQHGLDLVNMRFYDLFVLPIVVSAVIAGRRGPIIFGAGAIVFTIVSFLVLPRTLPLQQYWDGVYTYAFPGSVYDIIAVPCVIQLLTATAAWLGSDSVRRALLEASRADELAGANEQIQAQARSLEMQRYRQQQAIAHLQQVHAAVARGQWDARANVSEGELMPVALSLNLLLDRLSRLTREAGDRERVDAAAHELALALRRLRAGEAYNPPNYTGTPLDEVLVELARLRNLPPPGRRTAGPSLEGQGSGAGEAGGFGTSAFGPSAPSGPSGPSVPPGAAMPTRSSGLSVPPGRMQAGPVRGPQSGGLGFAARGAPAVSGPTGPGARAEPWPDLVPPQGPTSGELLPPWLRETESLAPEVGGLGGGPGRRGGPGVHVDEMPTTQQPQVTNYLPPWLQRAVPGPLGDAGGGAGAIGESGGSARNAGAGGGNGEAYEARGEVRSGPKGPPIEPVHLPPWLREVSDPAQGPTEPIVPPQSVPPQSVDAEPASGDDEVSLPSWLRNIE